MNDMHDTIVLVVLHYRDIAAALSIFLRLNLMQ